MSLHVPKFRMLNIWNSSIEGEWMTSLDLMGTHSSPVDSANKYLRFIGGYIFYQFTALPFSIATVFVSSSPR